LRLTGSQDELDFETVGREHVDDGSQVPAAQSLLGQVAIKDNGVEKLEHGLAGERGYEVGEILTVWDEPDGHNLRLPTGRSLQRSTDLELQPERAGLSWGGVAGARKLQQGVAKDAPVGLREPERDEEDGLEAPYRMRWRQQVVAHLRVVDDSSFRIRKLHGVYLPPDVPVWKETRTGSHGISTKAG
jgi:hypothetical protein